MDTVYIDFKNETGLKANRAAPRREGFRGKIAIHPGQIAVRRKASGATVPGTPYANAGWLPHQRFNSDIAGSEIRYLHLVRGAF